MINNKNNNNHNNNNNNNHTRLKRFEFVKPRQTQGAWVWQHQDSRCLGLTNMSYPSLLE
jgi:hypothetical protein